jgi:DNA repair exonuclease SbcCD ATPase subunit
MVEEISEKDNDQFSPDVLSKMEELEQALSRYLEETQKKKEPSPRPPGIPPSWKFFMTQVSGDKEKEDNGEDKGVSLQQAEKALEKLRQRLRQEEESLAQAEEALKQSMQEEEVLQKAEDALQKSWAAADKRKAEAIRRTEAAVKSAEKLRREQEAVQDDIAKEVEETRTTRGTIAINNKPRPTISLQSFLYGKEMPDDAPSDVPILYDWVQYVDGSITGRVKGSRNFKDGGTVSTSPVKEGARGGTVVTTASGSK